MSLFAMAYIHKLRHRKLHELRDGTGDLVVREPQKPDTISKGSTKPSASSIPVSDVVVSDPVSNVVSVFFVTATATFTGDTTFVTLSQPAAQPSPAQASTYVVSESPNIQPSSIDYGWVPPSSWAAAVPIQTSAQQPAVTGFGAVPVFASSAESKAASRVDAPSGVHSSSLPTSIAVAVSSSGIVSSYIPSRTASRPLATASSSSTAAAQAASTGGMTSGGKVGLAIGIILIIALIAGGGLWFYWKKKKDNEWQKPDDEKTGFGLVGGAMAMKSQNEKPLGATTANKHDSNAPRLSLRPVTQFIPDLAAKQLNPQNNANNPSGMAAAGAGRNLTPGNPAGSAWERRPGGEAAAAANPFKDPVNPFGDQARSGPPPPNVTVTPPMSDDGSSMKTVTAVAAGAAVGVAGAALAAGAGRNSPPSKNRPGRPQGGSGVAGGPPGNVYRVQLDFKPSMEDELELCAGQLVRVLHEYDDGWVCWHRLINF